MEASHQASKELKKLGEGSTNYQLSSSDDILEVFPAPKSSSGEMVITLDCPEFTANCPKTGQPDFGQFKIDYIPNELCVESKSLKLFLFSFRNEGHFHEEVTKIIHDKLFEAMKPKWLRVQGIFMPRGGISIHPCVESGKKD